jgi:hypothetical protein
MGPLEDLQTDIVLDPIVMSKVEENILNFLPSYREVLVKILCNCKEYSYPLLWIKIKYIYY